MHATVADCYTNNKKNASNDLKTGQQPETTPNQSLTKFEAKASSKTAASNSNR